jgi:glycosidase
MMLAEGADPELHRAGFDVTYAWNTYHTLKRVWDGAPADTLFAVLAEEEAALPPGAERLRFTTNHDETAWDATPLELFGGTEGAQAAAVVAATLPGLLLLYNGQEVGDTQQLPLFEKVAIDWDADPAMRAFYDNLLERRAANPAFISDVFEPIEHDASDDVLAYYRGTGDERQLVAVNVRDREVTTTLPGADLVTLAPYEWRIESVR